jgi:hypothetical protein
MILSIIILFFLAIILWILLSPMILLIDTRNSIYSFSLKTIASVRVEYDDWKLLLHLQILFYKKTLIVPDDFIGNDKKEKKPKKKKVKKKKEKKTKISILRAIEFGKKYLGELLDSFQVKELYVNFDTKNYPLNGMLIPVFSTLNYYSDNIHCYVNFEGNNIFYLDLRNRLWNFLVIAIKGFFDYRKLRK